MNISPVTTPSLVTKDQVKDLIRQAQKILIAPSAPMDGDSVGSALALMSALRKLGKEVVVVAYEKTPESLKFLPFTHEIVSEVPRSKDFVISLSTMDAEVEHLKYEVENGKLNIIVSPKSGIFKPEDVQFVPQEPDFDLIITVDTGDLVQLGKLPEEHKNLFNRVPVLNIDHHASNGKFGTHNYLEYNFSATTQMITPILFDLEKEYKEELIDEEVATLLLVGIITDTGSFQHTNTTPEAFEVAADLLDRGARQQDIIKHIYKTKSLATLKLWGRVLSKIEYDPVYKVVYSVISQKDLQDTGAASEETGGIIDELMTSAPDAEVVFLLKEKEAGFVSGSMRAPGQLADVSQIAKLMNGGGHRKAAGFRLRDMSLEEALSVAKQTVAAYMAPRLDLGAPVANSIDQANPAANLSNSTMSGGTLFPGLVAHPSRPQNSVPVPSAGGEDLLLQDFRKRSEGLNPNTYSNTNGANAVDPREAFIRETSARFFQDADGQVKSVNFQNSNPENSTVNVQNNVPADPAQFGPGATVEDVLRQFPQQ